MIFKLYLFLLGILFCSFGIYQFLVGKPTILSKNLGSITNFVGFPIPLVALSAHIE